MLGSFISKRNVYGKEKQTNGGRSAKAFSGKGGQSV